MHLNQLKLFYGNLETSQKMETVANKDDSKKVMEDSWPVHQHSNTESYVSDDRDSDSINY